MVVIYNKQSAKFLFMTTSVLLVVPVLMPPCELSTQDSLGSTGMHISGNGM